MKKKICIRTRYVYIPFVVALAAGVNSNPSSRERFSLRTANPRQDPNSCIHYEPAAAAAAAAVESRNIRCRKHERTSTYTAVRDFSV